MRADRLLSIMLLLQTRHQLTARDLAQRLEVSERTIHRDMEALSAAGIPVVAERGAGGGWSILGEYRTNLTGLSEAEIQSLFVKRPTRLLADLNLEKASEGALLKLLAALPSMYRRGAERASQRVYVDVAGWHRPEEAMPLLPVLQQAIWLERKLQFSYQSGLGCAPAERTVSPLGLVAKGSVWYLVAFVQTVQGVEAVEGVKGDIRSYRVSRVQVAKILDEPSVCPEGFDLAEYWEKSAARFKASLPAFHAKMRARSDIVHRLSLGGRFARVENMGQPDEQGRVEVSFRFDVEEMACEYALAFGPAIEVLAPESLRNKVVEAAKAVLRVYELEPSVASAGSC
jgi:predicted DNA-binding transcriptional regulator YafY